MDNEQQIKLGTAPIGRLLFKLAIPTIAAQVVNIFASLKDKKQQLS